MNRAEKTFLIALIAGAMVFGYGWHRASHADQGKYRPKAQTATLQLKSSDGPNQTILQLLRTQQTGLPQIIDKPICRLTIQNSAGGANVIVSPPTAEPPEFEFKIGPGQSVEYPDLKGHPGGLSAPFLRTDGITKAIFYWEFCE